MLKTWLWFASVIAGGVALGMFVANIAIDIFYFIVAVIRYTLFPVLG